MKSIHSPAFVITVSGSDASGCSGVQADNRALLAAGVSPLNVISALTLQTSDGVESMEIMDTELVRLHIHRLLNAFPVGVIKAGMLGNAEIVKVLAETLKVFPQVRLVLDPVIRATSGRPLLNGEGMECLKNELLPLTYLLTPNFLELAQLAGVEKIDSNASEKEVVKDLLSGGCQAILVKGGHRDERLARDRLYTENGPQDFASERIITDHTRGSGCALASLIAGALANGRGLVESVEFAKGLLDLSLKQGRSRVWPGKGPAFW